MRIKKTLVAGVASLGLVVGLSGFAGATSGTNSVTGPDSTNIVKHIKKQRTRVNNNNNLTASNVSSQTAMSGHADATHNTEAGDAWSGDADNSNSLSATVHVSNSASGAGAVAPMSSSSSTGTNSNTGPDSYNVVKSIEKSSVHVTNNNNLNVANTSSQTATSGNATVSDNASGGSAVTGNVSNDNSTSLNFSVTN